MKKMLVQISIIPVFMFLCSACQESKQIHIYIPMNYTGWVNILHDQPGNTNKPLIFGDNHIYLVTGNPAEFKVSTGIYSPAWYEVHYSYYDTDTTFETKNIYYEKVGQVHRINKYGKDSYTSIFYVSKKPIHIEQMNDEDIPSNPLLEER